jgi:hypothetical protein
VCVDTRVALSYPPPPPPLHKNGKSNQWKKRGNKEEKHESCRSVRAPLASLAARIRPTAGRVAPWSLAAPSRVNHPRGPSSTTASESDRRASCCFHFFRQFWVDPFFVSFADCVFAKKSFGAVAVSSSETKLLRHFRRTILVRTSLRACEGCHTGQTNEPRVEYGNESVSLATRRRESTAFHFASLFLILAKKRAPTLSSRQRQLKQTP